MRVHAFLTTVFVMFSVLSLAQPTQRALGGCHHTRNKAGKMKELSLQEKRLLNESIARSDTFDIVKYTIAIDVTSYNTQQIAATTIIDFAPRMDNQSHLRLDLYNLTVDSVIQNAVALPFIYDGNILTVNFPESLVMEIHRRLPCHITVSLIRILSGVVFISKAITSTIWVSD